MQALAAVIWHVYSWLESKFGGTAGMVMAGEVAAIQGATAPEGAPGRALPVPLLEVAVRRQGLRAPWRESVGRLLRGQPIRRGPPEQMALDCAAADLLALARRAGGEAVQDLAVAVTVEGQGPRRVVTVIMAGRPWRVP